MGTTKDISMSNQAEVPNTTKHLFIIDALRAICMIWIICVWHLWDYLPREYSMSESAYATCGYITIFVLSAFTFISGLVLSKYRFSSYSDIKEFYIRRLKRFYVLYVIAVLLFHIVGWSSWKGTIKLLLGIGIVNGCAPITLWYMCMLMAFYAITPFIRYVYPDKTVNAVAVVLTMLVLMFILRVKNVILLYFAVYVVSLFAGQKVIAILNNVWRPRDESWMSKTVAALAYCSFCAYLYHRIVFWCVANMFADVKVMSILAPMSISTSVIAVLILFPISYGVQYAYDKIVLCITNIRKLK